MLKVISLNLNGIRSAAKKGVFEWLATQQADLVCVQELKARASDMQENFLRPLNFTGYFHYAEKPGYSGVGVYTRQTPKQVQIGFNHIEFDSEGRYVEADFGNLVVISAYFPSGSSSEARQAAKFRFLADFAPHLAALRARGKEVLLCGDVNIAHKEIDLKNWKGNLKNSGFLPEERAWLTHLFDQQGYVDVFRQINPNPDQFTWWSNRGQARAKNVGWRIDYQIATPGLAAKARNVSIYTEQRFSDHAPLLIEYDY